MTTEPSQPVICASCGWTGKRMTGTWIIPRVPVLDFVGRQHHAHPASTAAISCAPVRRDDGPPSSTNAAACAGRSRAVPSQIAASLTGPVTQPVKNTSGIKPANIVNRILNVLSFIDLIAQRGVVAPQLRVSVDQPPEARQYR